MMLCLMMTNSSVLAENSEVENHMEDESKNGGYLKLGFGYRNKVSPYKTKENEVTISIEGRYQWENGLFVELPGVSNKLSPGISYGYNFYSIDDWNFDLVGNKSHGDINYGVVDGDQSIEIDREGSVRAGFRITGSYGSNSIQFIVMPYSYNDEYDDGLYTSLWLAKEWQIDNWNVHASAGLQYRSEEILDYYYGISEDISTDNSPTYQAKGGFNSTVQFGVDYPISENWVFETYFRYTKLSDSITDSPIISNAVKFDNSRSEDITEAAILVSYVF